MYNVCNGVFAFSGIDVEDVCEMCALVKRLCEMLHVLENGTEMGFFWLNRYFRMESTRLWWMKGKHVRELFCRGAGCTRERNLGGGSAEARDVGISQRRLPEGGLRALPEGRWR